jgi:arylsulfatase A
MLDAASLFVQAGAQTLDNHELAMAEARRIAALLIRTEQMKRFIGRAAWLLIFSVASNATALAQPQRPNIVYILADDLGYGDVHVFNPVSGKIPTPHLDRLASQGMMFRDAHSGSAVCSPTRYGLLTGRYSWRTRMQSGVLNGYSPPLIAPDRLTVPAFLKLHGYKTACIGKWHLGWNWEKTAGVANAAEKKEPGIADINWTAPINNGPTTVGFDYYFGISASLDMPPYVFIENDRVTAIPTTEKKWIRSGPAAADFEAIDVLPALMSKAIARINDFAKDAREGKPFFLYLPLASPHTPVLPTKEWQGKSGLGDYGDFVLQTDAAIGDLLALLDKQGLTDNTLVIVTSDNGFAPPGDPDRVSRNAGHNPSGPLRGSKADIWEGGHRVPFIARWPAKIRPGSQSERTICHTDLLATCADLLEARLPENAGEDSVSFLPSLIGNSDAPNRPSLVNHSSTGRFAIREANWKLEFCPGSGGWAAPTDAVATEQNLPRVQLYNLATDLAETKNLYADHPEIVQRLRARLEAEIANGRSTPGPKQSNDIPQIQYEIPATKQ